ncbi:MAG: type VI secretion system-associated protein TagF [Burkholderiales bacterium]
MTGLYGKLPSHGDFVLRELPQDFVQPWDTWLQASIVEARRALADEFANVWSTAPPWRFRLPAGACGNLSVVGVLLPSEDLVGRQFPLTLAALLRPGASAPNGAWYAALETTGCAARDRGDSVDVLLAALPSEAAGSSIPSDSEDIPGEGWWMDENHRWELAALPSASQFRALLQGGSMGYELVSSALTHQGTVRTRNEDAFVDRGDIGLWAVADGAGGHGAGDVASAAVIGALADLPPGLSASEMLAQVRLRIGAVHTDLQRRGAASTNRDLIASTVVVLIARGSHFACLWAGDSRAYLLREGNLCQITRDHSAVQEMVEAGLIAAEDAESHPEANIITRAVGAEDALELDKVSGRVAPGDRLLLCSDGLFKALTEGDIETRLAAGEGADALVAAALAAGARDNVTAVVVSAEG